MSVNHLFICLNPVAAGRHAGLKREQTRRKEKDQKKAKAFRDPKHDVTKMAENDANVFHQTRNVYTHIVFNFTNY